MGVPAFYVLREYCNLAGQVVLAAEHHLRADTILRYDRNLPWERGVLRRFFPWEFPCDPQGRIDQGRPGW